MIQMQFHKLKYLYLYSELVTFWCSKTFEEIMLGFVGHKSTFFLYLINPTINRENKSMVINHKHNH